MILLYEMYLAQKGVVSYLVFRNLSEKKVILPFQTKKFY